MSRLRGRKAVPAIAPYIDQSGRPTHANPSGQYRPNPQLAATAQSGVIAQLSAIAESAAITQAAAIAQLSAIAESAAAARAAAIVRAAAIAAPPAASEPPPAAGEPPADSEAPTDGEPPAGGGASADGEVSGIVQLAESRSSRRVRVRRNGLNALDGCDMPCDNAAHVDRDRRSGPLNRRLGAYARARRAVGLDAARLRAQGLSDHFAVEIAERRARIRRRVQRTTAVIVAIGSSFVGVTAASAYFQSTGSGTGSVSTGTLQTITASGAVVSNLIPDGTPHDVSLTVTNPNAFAVTLNSVVGNGTINPDAGHSTCSLTGVTFTDQTGLSVSIPANANNSVVTLTGAASMDTTSANACQGATFTIPVTISVHK
jgi:hypothetical protein